MVFFFFSMELKNKSMKMFGHVKYNGIKKKKSYFGNQKL